MFSQDRLTQIFGDEYTAPVLRKGKLKDLILSVEELQSKLGDCGAEGQVYKPVDDYFVNLTEMEKFIIRLSNINMTNG